MKVEAGRYVLVFQNGANVVWEAPEFMTKEEGIEFLQYVSEELSIGANQYFSNCCHEHAGTDRSASGIETLALALKPRNSRITKLIFSRLGQLMDEGRNSLKKRKIAQQQENAPAVDLKSKPSKMGMKYE